MTFIIDTYGKNWTIMARKCLIQRENLGKNYSKNIIWFVNSKKEISNVPKLSKKWEIHGRAFVLYIYIYIYILTSSFSFFVWLLYCLWQRDVKDAVKFLSAALWFTIELGSPRDSRENFIKAYKKATISISYKRQEC